jgi:hypothetical protein
VSSVHEEEKPFKPNICDTCFAGESKLNYHVSRVHEEKNPFTCNICDASLLTKQGIKSHIDSVHERKKHSISVYKKR